VLALALPRDRSTVIEVVPEPVTTRA
jgi:hypothetical protein